MPPILIPALVVVSLFVVIFLFFIFQYVSLWMQAMLSGTPVQMIDLILMRFRRVDPKTIVFNRISAHKAGLDLYVEQLETHYLAGGRVTNVVHALIRAKSEGLALTWEQASAADFAGTDVDGILDAAKRWEDASATRGGHELTGLVGAQGASLTRLDPGGMVQLGDQQVEALADSDTIDAGVPIVVTGVYVMVRPL